MKDFKRSIRDIDRRDRFKERQKKKKEKSEQRIKLSTIERKDNTNVWLRIFHMNQRQKKTNNPKRSG